MPEEARSKAAINISQTRRTSCKTIDPPQACVACRYPRSQDHQSIKAQRIIQVACAVSLTGQTIWSAALTRDGN